MPNIKLVVEYDGTRFHGWQKQRGLRTVQSELERVLRIVLRSEIGTLHASGRTDSGVHARAQVVTFTVETVPDLHRLANAVSHLMRTELGVVSAEVVSDDFHPATSSKRKQYSYTLLNRTSPAVLDRGRCWHLSRPLDLELMKSSACVVIGEHDFSGFRDSECTAKSPIKTIYESEVLQKGEFIIYRVVGSGFLKQMVRNLVGTLVALGNGKMCDRTMLEVLERKDRRLAGPTAPPWGLCLDWVEY